ncbi:PLC-like phosphodiesterase [Clohesyomyces aquaticus]|uniref:Phosphoinositide phospholipase C n=1 Tax=Clohesyomyces aquaticus TaxID=1231657 RepID=A0A1Y1YB55_9PLEO|nr:PLC-like phosphodiesterase [Clohesyomyces aquaticus]
MAELISGLAKLSPFSKTKKGVDEDDYGEEIDAGTVAGGGHAGRQTTLTKEQLRVSHALKKYLVHEGVLSERDAGVDSDQPTEALRALLNQPHVNVPAQISERSHPLPDYFVSSSHNTYLMAHQLFGESKATAYETALLTGSRCVEIDAWDNDDDVNEPKVTHGYTLVSHIPFRKVCETIRDVVDKEAAEAINAAPIMISLENHCSAKGQLRLAQIMIEIWGHRLLSKAIRDKGTREQEGGEHVTLAELGSKIIVIVEYHLPNEETSSDSDSSSEDEEERKQHEAYRQQKKATNTGIIPELAELGVYAQSVKPTNNSWFETQLENAPHHHLINVSETGLKAFLPAKATHIARHNSQHLMRVFPKGTRISSKNLSPVPFWGIGAQICAMNWQTFGAPMQLNEALFSGSDGYVLKPAALRGGGSGNLNTGRKKKLRLHIAGATDVPIPPKRDADHEIKPYLTCTLVHPNDLDNSPPKRKTAPYKPHHKVTSFLHRDNPPATDPLWKETLEWEYEDNELVFLRLLIKSDDSFASNPTFSVAALRVLYAAEGWRFIRMLDLKGHETTCSLLVKIEVEDV